MNLRCFWQHLPTVQHMISHSLGSEQTTWHFTLYMPLHHTKVTNCLKRCGSESRPCMLHTVHIILYKVFCSYRNNAVSSTYCTNFSAPIETNLRIVYTVHIILYNVSCSYRKKSCELYIMYTLYCTKFPAPIETGFYYGRRQCFPVVSPQHVSKQCTYSMRLLIFVCQNKKIAT